MAVDRNAPEGANRDEMDHIGGNPPSPQRVELELTMPRDGKTTALVWRRTSDNYLPPIVLGHGGRRKLPSSAMDVIERQVGGIARELWRWGHSVLAFNFAYGEEGRRRPDAMYLLDLAFRDALRLAREELDDRVPIFGGRSMGARVASHIAAEGEARVGLILLGYPLHPRNFPDHRRTQHWPKLGGELLFVQGEHDHLCENQEFSAALDLLPASAHIQHHIIQNANHRFRIPGRSPQDVQTQVGRIIGQWAATLKDQSTQGH